MGEDRSAEAELWAIGASGDARAFGAIFDLHRDAVFRAARRLVDDVADAEDLTGVTFLQLWRRRRDVIPVNGSVLPWLLVTTQNTARNLARTRRRYERFLAALPAPTSIASVRELDPGERYEALVVSLRALRPIDQNLVLLTQVEGYSLLEASEVLGITYGAAKTRLSRAKARLRISIPPHPRITVEETSQ